LLSLRLCVKKERSWSALDEDRIMQTIDSIAKRMAEAGIDVAALAERTGLERRVVEAIIQGRYTPSPAQRQQLAAVLGAQPDEITWGHVTPVEAMYGHGPQFGRSP